jgi:cytochrome P450
LRWLEGERIAMSVDPAVQLMTPESAACPHANYARLRNDCPVARPMGVGGPINSRHDDVVWALRHPEIFSSEMDIQMALGTERPMIPQQLDPPRQTEYRRILDPLFSRRRMAALEPPIRAHANQLIDAVIDEGRCEFDSAFAIPLPCTAFLSLMGLPLEDLTLCHELKNNIIRPDTGSDPEAGSRIRRETGRRIYSYFEDLIDERTRDPRDDLMTRVIQSEIDGRKLTREEILDISFLLLLGGLDTVTATLGCNIAYLAENPEQRRRIVENPELISDAVEELLRWETPVMGVPRLVKRDVTLAGVELKSGELCTLLLGAANTDEARFEHADVVDFDRERNPHLAFGVGPHRCLGSHLARLELCIALEEWHRRIPDYAIQPGETPRYSPGIREVLYLPLVWDAQG